MTRFTRQIRVAGVFAALLPALGVLALSGRAGITTDLFELLPEERRDPLAAAAMTQMRERFFQKVSAVIIAPREDADAALAAAHALKRALRDAPLVLNAPGAEAGRLREAYRAHRFRFLTEADRRALAENPEGALRQRLLANLARPGGFDAADPGGFLERFLATLPGASPEWTLRQDLLVRLSEERVHVFIDARLEANALNPKVQQQLDDAFAAGWAAVEAACTRCSLHWTGAVRFSKATREAAERDIALLSTLALAGIALLFGLGFRTLRPLFAAFGVLAAAMLAGLAASFAIFGAVHVLTLVFGTTLLGLCIDYVLHLLVHRWAHPQAPPAATLDAVSPGLALGLATSVTAFLFLLLAGFPALSQIAVFSCAGLGVAWLLVRHWLPHVLVPSNQGLNSVQRLLASGRRMPGKLRLAVLSALALTAAAGLPRLHVVDDVRGLQAVPAALAADDAAVRAAQRGLPALSGGADFFLVEADSLKAALEQERAFAASVQRADFFGLSRFLPTAAEQQRNLDAWHAAFANGHVDKVLAEFGFRPDLRETLRNAYLADAAADDVMAEMLASPAFADLHTLYVGLPHGAALIARVPELRETPAVRGVRLVQPLENVERTFGAIRYRALVAVAAAYALMLGILSFRYGPAGGLRALAPAVFGAAVALGMLGLAGLPLNIFSLVALILVLGIGADYALFLREGAAHYRPVRLATALAAVTSLLSFGLLMFSSLPALQAFGFVTAAGIFAAYVAAPLALPGAFFLARRAHAAAGEP